jgi:pimeloyl-ACP methyl ester carboxylesterase
MDIILIPGFWLDASSWDDVVPALRAAGHTAFPLTLPGLESKDVDRSSITLRDHIDAVVSVIDSLGPDPVVLVGHSGGGDIAHAVVDARPARVARVVYVDTGPLGDGGVINDELPSVGGEIPLPDWSEFSDEQLTDLDDRLRAAFRERAVPEPLHVAIDPQSLHDDARYDAPVTIIACGFTADQVRSWIAEGEPEILELAKIRQVDLVDLPTGHWPQFTRPADLAATILAAIS